MYCFYSGIMKKPVQEKKNYKNIYKGETSL